MVTDTIRMLVSGLRRRARRSKVREDEERDFERAMARVLGLAWGSRARRGEGRDARADDDAMTAKRVDEKREETVRLTTD